MDGWLLRAADGLYTAGKLRAGAGFRRCTADLLRAMEQVEAWNGGRGLAAGRQVTDYAAPAHLQSPCGASLHKTALRIDFRFLTGNLAALKPPTGARIELRSPAIDAAVP